MATFAVTVEPVRSLEPIKGADFIEAAVVGDYRCVVKRGEFSPGDLVAYIPEASLVPSPLLEEMGLTGKLAGPEKNRVKAIKLRGTLSQGLCYPAREGWVQGQDVTEILGVTKWTPSIPTHLAGQVENRKGETLVFDVENFKRYPDVLHEGESVEFTEKIHGTWQSVGITPHGDVIVCSKGMSAKGLALSLTEKNQHKNLYVRTSEALDIPNKLRQVFGTDTYAYVLGEIFGSGVQDLHYGANAGQDQTIGFRAFDIYVGRPGQGRYLDRHDFRDRCAEMGLETVPVLYEGPFSREAMLAHTDGRETVSGQGKHIREGIVIRPLKEREDPTIGRVILKSVSAKYLTRKGGTEYE